MYVVSKGKRAIILLCIKTCCTTIYMSDRSEKFTFWKACFQCTRNRQIFIFYNSVCLWCSTAHVSHTLSLSHTHTHTHTHTHCRLHNWYQSYLLLPSPLNWTEIFVYMSEIFIQNYNGFRATLWLLIVVPFIELLHKAASVKFQDQLYSCASCMQYCARLFSRAFLSPRTMHSFTW